MYPIDNSGSFTNVYLAETSAMDLIEAFRADSAPRLGQMREAIANGDTKGLSDAAHAIKGGAQQMGADALASICQKLELAAMDTAASELVRWVTGFCLTPKVRVGPAGRRNRKRERITRH